MTIQDRARAYNQAFPQFPDSHFVISKRWIQATWILGNNYRGSGYYGSYPPGYLKRVYSMFPEHGLAILHLFSGSLTSDDVFYTPGSSIVIRANDKIANGVEPDWICNAENFYDDLFGYAGQFDVIFADPPYSKLDAKKYGVKLCNKKRVLGQCYKALKPGGLLFWMDTRGPMWSKQYWKWVGIISLYRSSNHVVRGVWIFERQVGQTVSGTSTDGC